jgi:hypothetical protein
VVFFFKEFGFKLLIFFFSLCVFKKERILAQIQTNKKNIYINRHTKIRPVDGFSWVEPLNAIDYFFLYYNNNIKKENAFKGLVTLGVGNYPNSSDIFFFFFF